MIERPQRDENGDIVYKKNGSMSVDASLRDTEDIPLTEDINEYFEREVLPFSSDAWVDRKKIRLAMKFPLLDFSISTQHQSHQKSLLNASKIRGINCRKLPSTIREGCGYR